MEFDPWASPTSWGPGFRGFVLPAEANHPTPVYGLQLAGFSFPFGTQVGEGKFLRK